MAKNRDGNTPLHVAAFMGRFEIVNLGSQSKYS